ncbi:MAG TPA: glycosyltransferase [Planctomycetota bacterium]|jgi:glycosyltransferase involved in cell wall biosynthesis
MSNAVKVKPAHSPRLERRYAQPAPAASPPTPLPAAPDADMLRRCAWDIGSARPAEKYQPSGNHAALMYVSPRQGFAHWRMLPPWVDQIAASRGGAWNGSRPVLRLYDTTSILFNGFNARRFFDIALSGLAGQQLFGLPQGGTTQVAEAGFLLRNGEFIPAARSQFVQFPPDGPSLRADQAALLVDEKLQVRPVASLWEHESFTRHKRILRLKTPLRIAALAMEASACGQSGLLPTFVSELASAQQQLGHEVSVFVPVGRASVPAAVENGGQGRPPYRDGSGVHYHFLDVALDGSPVEVALRFSRAVQQCLAKLPAFDLIHLHEWQTGMASWLGTRPAVVSLSSIEASRLNGTPAAGISLEIQKAERELLKAAECVLAPAWLRERISAEYGVDQARVREIALDGRVPNEWERPLDAAAARKEFGFEPNARVLSFIGPLEYAAGADLLVESWPTVVGRCPMARLALIGLGGMQQSLQDRANQMGIGHAVRLFGHLEGQPLIKLLRSSEALVLPSRQRVQNDEAVVDLARRAGVPVVTTHGGPGHLVRHEETGVVTYDNPGSMVWAMDRILGDPLHAARMGQVGKRGGAYGQSWPEVARYYLDVCAEFFPELTK